MLKQCSIYQLHSTTDFSLLFEFVSSLQTLAGATILGTIDSELEEICAGDLLRDVLSKWFVRFANDEDQFARHEIETQGKPPKPK